MTVTALEPYPKGKGRTAIYLNDKFAFVLYKGELSQYGLEVGVTVDVELYSRIMNETVFLRAKKRAMNLLQKMDRSEADIRRKLSDGGYPPEAVDVAVEYIRSYGYIDDLRYAKEYIRAKASTTSRRQISMKLYEKGISKDVTQEAFRQYEDENGPEDSGEAQTVARLINKRCPNGINSLDYEGRQKLFAYLYNKGFSGTVIEEVYSSIDQNQSGDGSVIDFD